MVLWQLRLFKDPCYRAIYYTNKFNIILASSGFHQCKRLTNMIDGCKHRTLLPDFHFLLPERHCFPQARAFYLLQLNKKMQISKPRHDFCFTFKESCKTQKNYLYHLVAIGWWNHDSLMLRRDTGVLIQTQFILKSPRENYSKILFHR